MRVEWQIGLVFSVSVLFISVNEKFSFYSSQTKINTKFSYISSIDLESSSSLWSTSSCATSFYFFFFNLNKIRSTTSICIVRIIACANNGSPNVSKDYRWRKQRKNSNNSERITNSFVEFVWQVAHLQVFINKKKIQNDRMHGLVWTRELGEFLKRNKQKKK